MEHSIYLHQVQTDFKLKTATSFSGDKKQREIEFFILTHRQVFHFQTINTKKSNLLIE